MEDIKEAIQQQQLSRGKMAFEFCDSTVAMRPSFEFDRIGDVL